MSRRDDLRAGIELLEAAVDCVAGCGCWESDPPWHAASRLAHARAQHDEAWARRTLAALDRIVGWTDEAAGAEAVFLCQMLHATGPPRAPVDARVFFCAAQGELARQLGEA